MEICQHFFLKKAKKTAGVIFYYFYMPQGIKVVAGPRELDSLVF
jgi:hypothetical protein